VASFAKPGGNVTGFVNLEASLSGKWLELMRTIAPSVSRIAFLFDPQTAPFAHYYLETFRSAAAATGIAPVEASFHSAADIEALISKLGSEGRAGLIVMPGTSTAAYREVISALAERYRVPTIYPFRFHVAAGGLLSYGIDSADLFRGAAFLRGVKPADIPIEQPTKFELVINLKTTKAIGVTVPARLVARADKVIE
jgi:putative ABC transport system substrate-binding protein